MADQTPKAAWTTRPAQAEDAAFELALFASTRADEVAAWGWTAEQAAWFLRMQFNARQHSYAQAYPAADDQIIQVGERPVGRLLVDRADDTWALVDIALLPEAQGAGIGTALLLHLQAEAASLGKPLRLTAEKRGRAAQWYARLGFEPVGEDDFYVAMVWGTKL
jgi:GNAT superfamily N-acetyltransferase